MTCPSPVSATAARDEPKGVRLLRACVLAGLLVAAMAAEQARAGDWLDDTFLRGSVSPRSPVRWEGVNFGATIGVSSINSDYSDSTNDSVAKMLSNSTVQTQAQPSTWRVLDSDLVNGRAYGAFLGYSTQWESLVLGFDVAYNHLSNSASTTGPTSIRRVTATSDGTAHDITITGQASAELIDYGTVRARAGYAFGQFLPYGFIGAAVARMNYSTAVSLSDAQTQSGTTVTYTPTPITTSRNNAIVGGVTTGLGLDVAIMPNMFVRGEWEFTAFGQVDGIRVTMNTGRVGLGLRF